mmetsp:Transcript_33211/g.59471  ORF Transcript_33211/g.59471 Transcript_33211/m.59471 type:complete len:99 (-) Transcript_33211:65-361(-)
MGVTPECKPKGYFVSCCSTLLLPTLSLWRNVLQKLILLFFLESWPWHTDRSLHSTPNHASSSQKGDIFSSLHVEGTQTHLGSMVCPKIALECLLTLRD